jgi:single-stranded-DNA-specific exonuclease
MKWLFKPDPDERKALALSKELGVGKLLSELLIQRGIDSFEKARHFFRPTLEELHDPFLMKDMSVAVDRIRKALDNKERILVYGDYDVDGTTAVSLVYSFLLGMHDQIVTYIPDRYSEGYGISYKGIDFASDNDIDLIIALDCGIKAVEKVNYAHEKGIDFIICDHHRPGDELPRARAVLNPKREDCNYPYKELCGCGIGFKLIQAISQEMSIPEEEVQPYLDLVATAIAADIVPMTGENRILAHFGLKIINEDPRPGIKSLIQTKEDAPLTITDVVFTIAPRINAAGRMQHGQYAVDLLTSTDATEAMNLAGEIDAYNLSRRELDSSITQEALEQIESLGEKDTFSTVVFDESWHKGVIGIVASRLIETYYRPTLVFTKSGSKLAGSARSVKGFDVYEALGKCEQHLEQFGGHKYAAGLTLMPENYEKFKACFEGIVKNTLDAKAKTPEILIDKKADLTDFNSKFYRILSQFGPFGPDNMKPVFMSSGLRDNGYGKTVGKEGKHLKLSLITGSGFKTLDAIGFNLGNKLEMVRSGQPFKVVYTLESNTWNGKTRLQLNLKDLQPDN